MAKKARPARHYQRDDDPVLRIARSAYRSVARELRSAFSNLSDMAPLDKLHDALKHGRNPASVINWHHYREVLRGAFTRLGRLRHTGGELGARKINGAFAARRRSVTYRKSSLNPENGGLTSKAAAHYRPGTDNHRCGLCTMFIRGMNACTTVAGVISANDTCDYFTAGVRKAGDDHYNPDEPRDEHGRWTTGGAYDPGKAEQMGREVATANYSQPPGRVAEGTTADQAGVDVREASGGRYDNDTMLYHATSADRIDSIARDGLKPSYVMGGNLLDVSLSPRESEARSYGDTLLRIRAGDMPKDTSFNFGPGASTRAGVPASRLEVSVGAGWVPLSAYRKRFTKAADQFTFDSFDPEIQDEIRDEQDRLIAQLESDARDAIETIIRDGVANDTPIDEMAADIKDMIGLTDTQAQAVLNYQRMLMDLDPTALSRGLRNKDYDASLQDAIDADAPLSDAAIENMVEDYIENYLDYRAATIAQTESTRAANMGLHDAYSQAIDRGALPDDAVTRHWQLADNPCPICESIVDNNPDGVGVDDSFDSDDGPIDDPPVHPNCECSVDYVTDLTKVPDDDESDSEYEYQTQTA